MNTKRRYYKLYYVDAELTQVKNKEEIIMNSKRRGYHEYRIKGELICMKNVDIEHYDFLNQKTMHHIHSIEFPFKCSREYNKQRKRKRKRILHKKWAYNRFV